MARARFRFLSILPMSLIAGRSGLALAASLLCAAARPAHAESFALAPGQQLVGAVGEYVTQEEDTLLDVARNHDLGYAQLMTVNSGIDPWLPGAGRQVSIPSFYLLPPGPRKGIVIDLAAQRLYYFPADGKTVESFPIGTGAEAGMTPRGTTKVIQKIPNPAWYPPASIRKERPELPGRVPPGPDNPLGAYALRLGWTSYLIHGSNQEFGVGRNVSHGCIRLYSFDIDRLFHEVPLGTPVRVIDQDMRFAWVDGELYLAMAPSHAQIDEISENRPMTAALPKDFEKRVAEAAGDQAGRIDWAKVHLIGEIRPGMAIAITTPADAPSNAMAPSLDAAPGADVIPSGGG
jgi:L,D-transpeptidase ErfK/SrfK